MSLAPLPNNSSKSLPLSSEGLTTARMVSDPRNGLAHAAFADQPDFAEIMTHIDQGASAPTSIQATDCCSGSEAQAVSEKTPAAAEDLHMDIDTSAADEPLFAVAFAETSRFATQDLPNGDESGERRPVLQPAAAYAESENAPVSHRNLAESAESETHLPEPDPPVASRQSRDGDTALAWPLNMTAREGEVTRVKDRVISLQEFTFVAGAARSGMSATMHDAAKPATYSALYAAGKEDGGLPHDGRDASSRPATETESAQKPQLTAVAVQTGSVGASSFALSLRDAAVGSQEVTVPEPDATPAWHQVAGRQRRAAGTETHGPANGPGLANLAMGAAASTASVPSPSHAPQSAADLPGASDQRADMSLTGKADPLRPENKSPFAGPAGSGGPAPLPVTTEDLAWDERRADSYGPLIQPEKAVVNRLKASVLDMPSSQAGQGIAPFATNLADSALLVGGGGIEAHVIEELGEGMTASAINTASAMPRPDASMPRFDLPRHVAQQIADVVTRAPDGPVDLHLNPEELGKVRISMAMVEGGINVTILAERPDTLDLMRRHIDQLAQEFRQLGYGLINFSFGQRNEGHDNRSDGGRNLAVSAAPEDTPRGTPADGRHGQENGLDMRI